MKWVTRERKNRPYRPSDREGEAIPDDIPGVEMSRACAAMPLRYLSHEIPVD